MTDEELNRRGVSMSDSLWMLAVTGASLESFAIGAENAGIVASEISGAATQLSINVFNRLPPNCTKNYT